MIDIPPPTTPWFHPDRLKECKAALGPALVDLFLRAEAAGWNGDEVAMALIFLATDFADARKEASEAGPTKLQ